MVAFEELSKTRLKRQEFLYLIVVQKLTTIEWLKQFYILCGIVMAVPAGLDCLGSENF